MINKVFLIFFSIIFFSTTCHAYEDCIISTNGKLTEIKIENNKIIDVQPLITVINDKNTLVVHPLNTGSTRFCVLKNNKEIFVFNVKIDQNKTSVDDVLGFDIQSLDTPPENSGFELDEPPLLNTSFNKEIL